MDKEKRAWEDLKKREKAHVDTEKERMESRRADLARQAEELEKEREQLREQRERLQRQIDMHRSTPDFLDSSQMDRRHSQPLTSSQNDLLAVPRTHTITQPQHMRWNSDEASASTNWSPATSRRTQPLDSGKSVGEATTSNLLQNQTTPVAAGLQKHSASTSRLPDAGCERLDLRGYGDTTETALGQRQLSSASVTLSGPGGEAVASTLSRPTLNGTGAFVGGSSAVTSQRQQASGAAGLGLPPLSLAESHAGGSTLKEKAKKKNKGFFK